MKSLSQDPSVGGPAEPPEWRFQRVPPSRCRPWLGSAGHGGRADGKERQRRDLAEPIGEEERHSQAPSQPAEARRGLGIGSKYLYFPGCSQKATSRPYEKSFLAVCERLGVELKELDDWNCCGATMLVSTSRVLSVCLPARNLARAERLGLPVVTPCPSCWLAFKKADRALLEDEALAAKVRDALSAGGMEYGGPTEVRHALDFLVNVVGIEKIRENVRMPLEGLRIAPYYGCQVVRPYGEDAGNPRSLERIIEAAGGMVADFPHRMTCCGSSLMVTRKELGERMSLKILRSIVEAGADLVVTPCGLCQVNLELAGTAGIPVLGDRIRIPVLDIAQLIGWALGIPRRELGIDFPLPDRRAGKREAHEAVAQGAGKGP